MHLILNVHSSNPDTNLDCECALLKLTKPFCDRLRRDIETLFRHRRELPDLYEVYFWRYAVEFYSFDLIAACDDCEAGWSGQFEKTGRAVLPVGMELAKFEPQRMECQQEIIRHVPAANNIVRLPENCFEIGSTAVPKPSDIYITTGDVTLPELWRCLAPEKATPKPQKRRRRTKS